MKYCVVTFGDAKPDKLRPLVKDGFGSFPIAGDCCFIRRNTNFVVVFSSSFKLVPKFQTNDKLGIIEADLVNSGLVMKNLPTRRSERGRLSNKSEESNPFRVQFNESRKSMKQSPPSSTSTVHDEIFLLPLTWNFLNTVSDSSSIHT